MTNPTIEKIIDSAESFVRSGGYNSFSFREISKEVGIKSASIHYHFPTKTDLGVALAKRYTERFCAKLDVIAQQTALPSVRLERYVALFRHALEVDRKMCLCGQLATESDALPELIHVEAKIFFEKNLSWLEQLVFADKDERLATMVLASLEGALMMSKVMQSKEPFDKCSSMITSTFALA